MRYLLVLLPLVAAGCADRYYDGYAYGDDYRYGPRYASNYDGYYGRPYYGGENCGTPYEPKACPPMPPQAARLLSRRPVRGLLT